MNSNKPNAEHAVGMLERVGHRQVLIHLQQTVIRDDNESVHGILEGLNAGPGCYGEHLHSVVQHYLEDRGLLFPLISLFLQRLLCFVSGKVLWYLLDAILNKKSF